MPPYPTPYAIEDLFNELTANRDEAVGSAMSDNVDVKVMGYDHHLASEPKGVDSLKKWIEEFATLYQDDTITFEVINVIGGGDSPWAAIEGNATAKSKTGKKFVHEFCNTVRFNGQGKIVKMRMYYDTHHIHSHAVDQGKASN